MRLPVRFFRPGGWLYRPRGWESDGAFYESVFRVKKWKDRLPDGAALFAGIGPEPFSRKFSAAYLLARTRGRKRPIKNLLMDGTVVAGIGNIYANEALFVAGIDPARLAGGLDRDGCRRLVRGCRQVLERAIACGGTTISDFVNSSGVAGSFQCELQVYGRSGEGCRSCGSLIRRRVLAGRATYSCPLCQR